MRRDLHAMVGLIAPNAPLLAAQDQFSNVSYNRLVCLYGTAQDTIDE